MPTSQTAIVINPPKAPEPSYPQLTNPALVPQISGEGYKLIDRLVDPNALYLDKLTTLLYSAHLQKSTTIDPESPVPGFKLTKIGGTKWKPNVNLIGYTTITSEVLMALSEDGSVTRFPSDFQLPRFCARQTMSIIGMMIANNEEWEFTNYTIIYPFGLTLWKALVATLSRSKPEQGKRALLDLIIHPNLWFTQGGEQEETQAHKWFNI